MHNTNIPCGCLIEYEGDQFHQDYSIDFCPLHKAAPKMLKILNKVADEPAYQIGRCASCGGWDGNHSHDCLTVEVRAAIMATGDEHGQQ